MHGHELTSIHTAHTSQRTLASCSSNQPLSHWHTQTAFSYICTAWARVPNGPLYTSTHLYTLFYIFTFPRNS